MLEGGDTDTERRCTFLELALALAGGLDAAGLQTLYKAAAPGMQARVAGVWWAWCASCWRASGQRQAAALGPILWPQPRL